MRNGLLILSCFIGLQLSFAQQIIEKDFSNYFNKYDVEGTFVVLDESTNTYFIHNRALADSGYLPASTFKVPHALIALEEGIVKDTSDIIPWDGKKRQFDVWNRDQTLRSSLQYSSVWVYIAFADQIDIKKYKTYLSDFQYGNENPAGPSNRFWLEGDFAISARQQVGFLQRFYHYELPVSPENIEKIKPLIVVEKTKSYTLSGKTGGTTINKNQHIMWLVGYVERDNKVYYYALNYVTDDWDKTQKGRREITKAILSELGLLNQ